MLKQRLLTALVGLPLLLALFAYGPRWSILLVFMVFVALATFEMGAMMLPRLEMMFGPSSEIEAKATRTGEFLCIGLGLLVFSSSALTSEVAARGMLLGCLLLSILVGVFFAPDNMTAIGRVLGYLLTIIYGVMPWLAMWDLYLMGDGSRYVILLLAVVWSGDTGAYFGGRFLGKHKLAPRMSPKKTWEGAFAGLLASLAGGFLANAFWNFSLGSHTAIFLAALFGGALGQMGDLVESTFKRFAGVKDSGRLFPGHGGFLDRVDALLFAAPVIWFILYSSR